MTDQPQLPPASGSAPTAADERTLPIVAYALYLAGLATGGLTPIVGVIIAHASRDTASAAMRSHYEFLIRTFWIALAAFAVGGLALGIGVVLSFILIGIPIVVLAGCFLTLVGVWFLVRSVVGLIYVVQNQPHPRPQTWLV